MLRHARTTRCRWRSYLMIMSLWIVIIAAVFQFTGYMDNEVDVLPSARQFVSPTWLPADWYLNLDIEYRHLFNLLLGPVIDGFGFRTGTIVARLAIYFLLAVVLLVWIRTFQVRYDVGLLFVGAFFSNQSLVAGEWMAGGVETKTFAYACVLLSCAAFFRHHYRLGFACLGAAISFHILVGLYATCCTFLTLGLHWRIYRPAWRAISTSDWLFVVFGAMGWQAIIAQVLLSPASAADRAWDIYVLYRVPHHVLPDAWPSEWWPITLVLATALLIVTYATSRSPAARFTAAYALGSVTLFAVGLVVYEFGQIRLLRYYWFRFPDVIVPFMSFFVIALAINDLAQGSAALGLRWFDVPPRVKARLTHALSTILTGSAVLLGLWALVDIQHGIRMTAEGTDWHAEHAAMLAWIAEHTPQDAVFLVDPSMEEFYVYAQRSMFVSFKHFPQSPQDIVDWYTRIRLTNGQRIPVRRGYAAEDELRQNFYRLDQGSIEQIAQAYGVDYYLGLSHQPLTFERAYHDSTLTLYKIGQVPGAGRSCRAAGQYSAAPGTVATCKAGRNLTASKRPSIDSCGIVSYRSIFHPKTSFSWYTSVDYTARRNASHVGSFVPHICVHSFPFHPHPSQRHPCRRTPMQVCDLLCGSARAILWRRAYVALPRAPDVLWGRRYSRQPLSTGPCQPWGSHRAVYYRRAA